MSKEIIEQHVDYLKDLHRNNKLILRGPFSDYLGGIVIINADSFNEVVNIAKNAPFIYNCYMSFELSTLELVNFK